MAQQGYPENPGAADRAAAAPVRGGGQDRLAHFVQGALIQNISMADHKAGILFTLVSAALLFLFTRIPATPAGIAGLFWVLVVVLLVTAAGCAFTAIFPHVSRQGDPLLFWGAIAEQPDRAAYVSEACAADNSELSRRKLAYCHDLARICARKYLLLRVAMASAAAGLLLFLALLGLGLAPAASASSMVW